MSVDELISAIERRGCLVKEIKDVMRPAEIVVFLISRGAQWMEYGFMMQDIADAKLSVKDYVEHVLRRLDGGMEHVWCKQCHTPLLKQTDQPSALRFLQTSTKPTLMLKFNPVDNRFHAVSSGSAEEAIERASVYFDARIGYASSILEYCPKCGSVLAESVEDIRDE